MRQAVLRPASRQRKAQSTTIPAPITGWNARDALDLMAPTDAIVLDNFFPDETEVTLRRGFTEHATGLGATIETLMTYDSASTKKMFAAAGSNIYEVTSAGAVGAADQTGLTNARWQAVNLGTAGGHFLWICNGADTPRYYNGSSWANASLTGITATDVVNVHLHARRLFFALNDSLEFGYLAVNSVSGAVSTFDLSSLFSRGGRIEAIGTWTRDGGDGADDLAVFVTSNGEVAIYSGTDPATAADWALVGIFYIGRPIGRRCLFKFGSDLIVITEAGYLPLSQVLPSGGTTPNTAISDKISGAVKANARLQNTTFGWQAALYAKAGYGLFNVPQGADTYYQHIVNLNTGAWCRFTGQNAVCWIVHDGELYFGGPGEKVFHADNGSSDDGATIKGDGKTSFNYFESRGMLKRVTLAKPVMASDGSLPVSFGLNVDFGDTAVPYDPSTVASSGSAWGSPWGSPWAGSEAPATEWRTLQGLGYCFSFRVRTETSAQSVIWRATDVLWEMARGI